MIEKFVVGNYYTLDLENFKKYLDSKRLDILNDEKIIFKNSSKNLCKSIFRGMDGVNFDVEFEKSTTRINYKKEMLQFFEEYNPIKYEPQSLEV